MLHVYKSNIIFMIISNFTSEALYQISFQSLHLVTFSWQTCNSGVILSLTFTFLLIHADSYHSFLSLG